MCYSSTGVTKELQLQNGFIYLIDFHSFNRINTRGILFLSDLMFSNTKNKNVCVSLRNSVSFFWLLLDVWGSSLSSNISLLV